MDRNTCWEHLLVLGVLKVLMVASFLVFVAVLYGLCVALLGLVWLCGGESWHEFLISARRNRRLRRGEDEEPRP